MSINWKYLSISIFISIIVNGIALAIILFEYVNKMKMILNYLVSSNFTANSGNITNDKMAITIAQGQGLSFEVGVILFTLSFVTITIVSYFFLKFFSKKVNGRENEYNKK